VCVRMSVCVCVYVYVCLVFRVIKTFEPVLCQHIFTYTYVSFETETYVYVKMTIFMSEAYLSPTNLLMTNSRPM